jgi:hypothetical protein
MANTVNASWSNANSKISSIIYFSICTDFDLYSFHFYEQYMSNIFLKKMYYFLFRQ